MYAAPSRDRTWWVPRQVLEQGRATLRKRGRKTRLESWRAKGLAILLGSRAGHMHLLLAPSGGETTGAFLGNFEAARGLGRGAKAMRPQTLSRSAA